MHLEKNLCDSYPRLGSVIEFPMHVNTRPRDRAILRVEAAHSSKFAREKKKIARFGGVRKKKKNSASLRSPGIAGGERGKCARCVV